MQARDIEHLITLGWPTIDRHGDFAVVAASHPDIEANRAVGQLWRVELPAGSPRRLTRGTADTDPAISPDGARIAFLRADAEGTRQIWVVCADGGEPVQATVAPSGVDSFAWSPHGDRFAYVARIPEAGRYGSVEGLAPTAEAPRHITGIRWHADGLGYIADRPSHVFVIDAPSPEDEPFYTPAPAVVAEGEQKPEPRIVAAVARQVTGGSGSWTGTTWTPDGREILVIPDEIEALERDLRTRVVAVEVDGDGTREILGTAANLSVTDTAVAPDGTVFVLAYDVGPEGTDFVAPGSAVSIVADGVVRTLTDPAEVDLGEPGARIVLDGEDVLVQRRERGRIGIVRVTRDGDVVDVPSGEGEVRGLAAGAGRIVAVLASRSSAGELVVVDGESPPRGLTDFGASLRAAGLVEPREITIAGRDGYPVHGWIATPDGAGPFPVLLQIHGGPYSMYGVAVLDETQVFVDAGYAIVYCNPRGSAGYGPDHGKAIEGRMGTVDADDVMDFLDGALAEDPRLDSERVGVMGGSYGGYLTAWLIAHEHRFAAAIVERGFLDPTSFVGTSDIGSFFADAYLGTDPAAIAAQSPMAVVDGVRTATLLLHSEQDYRCPLPQATQYYMALKRRGIEVEMLLFPGENHELSRSGQPRHRVQRFDAIIDWWARHLPVG